MLDSYVRPMVDPSLNRLAKKLSSIKVTANKVTLSGFAFGLIAIFLITQQRYMLAVICVGINRLSDGLDGAIARIDGLTDFGGFLDITCDFIIYSGIVFAFALAQPEYALHACFLIFSYIGPITTFLAYAVMAEKYKITTDIRGKKSFYYLGGICEGTETAFIMVLLCLKPNWLPHICIIYGTMCWLTTIGRVSSAWTLASYIEQAELTKQPNQSEQ